MRAKRGIQAGLVAGLFVAVLIFVLDLVQLAPLSTPLSLSTRLWGPGRLTVAIPQISEAISIGSFAGAVLALTLLHFLVFAILGLGAVLVCDGFDLPVNPGTGALYGLLVCSLVFYLSLALGGGSVLEAPPGPVTAAEINLLAGALMGGYVQLTCGSHA